MTGRHTVIGPAHACTGKRIRNRKESVMSCRSEGSGLIERAIAGVHRVVPAGQSGFPESLCWRRLGRRYELPGPASWIVAAVAVVVFVAVLIAARDLLVPAR